jgi:hypothetical protein
MPRRRVDLRTAAETLGTSVDAVRKRVQRGTVEHEKGEDGRVYVWLDTDLDPSANPLLEAKDETIADLRDRVEFLQRELERKDAILLNMTEAMKAISPPTQEEPIHEPQEAPETATEQPGRVGPQPAVESAEEGVQPRRSWWRRMFGG